jgi:hypothetical protein
MAAVTVQKSAIYVWTQTDVNRGYCVVHINWRSPFPGTNYGCWFSVEDVDPTIDLSFFEGDLHNVTENGFDAIVYSYSPGTALVGDRIIIHAFAVGIGR